LHLPFTHPACELLSHCKGSIKCLILQKICRGRRDWLSLSINIKLFTCPMRKVSGVFAAIVVLIFACTPEENNSGKTDDGRDKTVHVTGISLDKTSLDLVIGETYTFVAAISPDNASDKNLEWLIDGNSVATLKDGLVTAVAKGKAIITVSAKDGSGVSATCNVVVSIPCPTGAVDMGFHSSEGYRIYWATCNVGASLPEDFGGLFAWGETSSKNDYTWDTYKWANGSETSLTKYNTDAASGTKDDLTTLEAEDDVASIILGNPWRMPTSKELQELVDNCDTEISDVNGHICWEFKSKKNGACIYFPLPGWYNGTKIVANSAAGHYWSASIYDQNSRSAVTLCLWNPEVNKTDTPNILIDGAKRYYGRSVRPMAE